MYHTHFNTIHSTQIYLRDNLIELKNISNEILISASEQTLGIGRKGSQWDSYDNAIAMSFTLSPNPTPTITPIEIGILTSAFLNQEYGVSISLKWPNDLMNSEGHKCGGLIAQYIDSDTVIAGLGINIGALSKATIPAHYKHGLGNISDFLKLNPSEQKEISAKLYQYILKNRIFNLAEVQTKFSNSCSHIGRNVLIDDDAVDYEGIFLGIGKYGEALVETEGIIRTFLSSSLKILN